MTPIPMMPLQQFIDDGYLQEANRRFLHPLGLALAIDADEGTVDIWNAQDDPEGWVFADLSDDDSARKAESVRVIAEDFARTRRSCLGFVIQPIGDKRRDEGASS